MDNRTCSQPDCDNPCEARGLCIAHYTAWRRGKLDIDAPLQDRPTVEQRFWSKVDASGDCWEWTASTRNGYGRFAVSHETSVSTHRFVWELLVGPIPDGYHIDHLCRNKICVNPDHLDPVTPRQNTLRSKIAPAAVNARKTHCKRGHPFNDENTYKQEGGRGCLPCKRERDANY